MHRPVSLHICIVLLLIFAAIGCTKEEFDKYTEVVAQAISKYLLGRATPESDATDWSTVEIVGCPYVLYYDDKPHHAVEMDWRCELTTHATPAAEAWRYARNIWVLKRVGDRLYMGSGNSSNRGPATNAGTRYGGVPVVYYDLQQDLFRTEAILDDEQIDRYVMLNKKLCIPGHDPTEDWSLGNYYCRQWDGGWHKHRVVPDAIHMYDLVQHNRYRYAAIARPYCPAEGLRGEVLYWDEQNDTWQTLARFSSRVYSFIQIHGKLFAVRELPRADHDATDEPYVVELTLDQAGMPKAVAHQYLAYRTLFPDTLMKDPLLKKVFRSINVGAYGVYIGATVFNDHQARPFGVYLADLNADGQVRVAKIQIAAGDFPWDLLVSGENVYLLTNTKNYTRQKPGPNIAKVYRVIRSNLQNVDAWEAVLQFQISGLARSFEKAGKYFYFGIGSEVGNSVPGTFTLDEILSDTGMLVRVKYDDAVKSPISALRFIPLSLRRTLSTPQDMGFATP